MLSKLNDILISAEEILKRPPEKPALIQHLEHILDMRKRDIQTSKNQNKIYKEQLDLLSQKAKNNSTQKLSEIELKIDTLKQDNIAITKKIRDMKTKHNTKKKVLENYSANKKYPQEIKSYTEEVKSLANKKHEYFIKLNNNKKSLGNCLLQMEKLEKLYKDFQDNKNYNNRKVEEEITKLKMDLNGTEEEIFNKVERGATIIVKQNDDNLSQNLLSNPSVRRTPKVLKPIQIGKLKPKLSVRNKSNVHSSHGISRRINIVAHDTRAKTPTKERDIDLSTITYETLTDYEYNEMLTKKEHYIDVNFKLEKSIREAKKMYERKIKEMNLQLEENSKKLSYIEQENELLKSEIADLTKISKLSEEEALIKQSSNINLTNRNVNKENTHSNNGDVSETRNDILNDLNVLNAADVDKNKTKFPTSILEERNEQPSREKGIKFEDISNVEHVDESKEINRHKVIDDIKKKYIKNSSETNEDDERKELIIGKIEDEQNENGCYEEHHDMKERFVEKVEQPNPEEYNNNMIDSMNKENEMINSNREVPRVSLICIH